MIVNTDYANSFVYEKILIQNNLIKHDIGKVLAKKVLGSSPRNTVIEHIEISPVTGQSDILLVEVYFNSELGSFNSLLSYQEFSEINGVHQHLLLINWLKSRFVNIPKVRIPRIYASDDQYIISEGAQRISFSNSPLSILNKATIAGEILASFHGTEQTQANSIKYLSLVSKTISSLSISAIRKEKLLSIGNTLLLNLNFLNSGVYGYGDFTTDNILIDGPRKGYVILPELVQFVKNADRFEDISNFFVSSALEEYSKFLHIKETLLAFRTFLRSYNSYLRLFGDSLEGFYYSESIYPVFYFHLGLHALIKTLFVSDNRSSQLDIAKFVNYIWSRGIMLLPEESFPDDFKVKRINVQGFAVSWVSIGKSLLDSLQNDSHFQLIYNRPEDISNLDVDDAVKYWSFKNKNILKTTIKELNSLFSEDIVTIEKNQMIYNKDLLKSYDFVTNFTNWEIISKGLRKVYLKKPENVIIRELIKKSRIRRSDLSKSLDMDKKTFSNSVKNLVKDKKILISDKRLVLNPDWHINLGNLARESIKY